jgi:hypothetical protein
VIPSNGSKPSGCQGKDGCNVIGWGLLQSSGAPEAFGYCFGGCSADTDCPSGSKCQTNDGTCVTTLVTPTKALGDPCRRAPAANPDPIGACSCMAHPSTGLGYCTQFCLAGANSPAQCPAGYVCDTQLPAQITASNDASVPGFATQNVGLVGSCLKTCTPGTGDAGGSTVADSAAGDAAGEGGEAGVAPTSDAASPAGGGACPSSATCSTIDTAGPDCIP